MVKIRCQDCGRIVEVPKNWDESADCSECHGYFEVYGSEDDTYEENLEEESEEESDDETYECDECGEEFDSEDDLIYFKEQEINICKKCINNAYPRESKIEYREKIIEKPVYKFIDKEGKESTSNNFDENKKTKFD